MGRLLACLPAALIFGSLGSLPAAADFSEDVFRMGDFYQAGQARDLPAPRRKPARAAFDAAEGHDEVRPGARVERRMRPRHVKRRHAKSPRSTRGHHRAARRATRRMAHQGPRRLRRAQRPRWERRNLAAADRPRGHLHGVASYYFRGHRVASGARFNPDGLTAAHRTLPFGTRVRVTHLGNGRSVNVVINDRGPFIGGRVIDLSRGAAGVIGMIGQGLARVSVTILGR